MLLPDKRRNQSRRSRRHSHSVGLPYLIYSVHLSHTILLLFPFVSSQYHTRTKSKLDKVSIYVTNVYIYIYIYID